MSFYNLARMYSISTGDSDIVLSTAVPGCLTFALAGVSDSEDVEYGLISYSTATRLPIGGECGLGKYVASGTIFKRTTVYNSTDSDNSQIDLTGLTEIYLTPLAVDLNGMFALPKTWTMWHDESIVTAGAALNKAFDGNQTIYYQDTAADSDEFTNGFYCVAGTYSINFLGQIGTGNGKLDIYVDNVLQGTVDFYNGTLVQSTIKTLSSLTFTSGYHTFKGKVNGKNGSSSGYTIALTKIYLLPASY